MTLFEIYYHDPWRTEKTFARQHIASTKEDAEKWLLENLNDWYDNNDPEINDLVDQALNQNFRYMTVKTITVDDDGTVEWE